jgi:hypothetical protein
MQLTHLQTPKPQYNKNGQTTLCIPSWSSRPFTQLTTITARGSQIFQKSRRHLQILSVRWFAQSTFYTQDPKFWRDLSTSLLSDAFSLMRVNCDTFLYVRGKNCNNYAENTWGPPYKIYSPGIWSPLITTMYNIVYNLINHEKAALYAGIQQPRQK